MGDVAAGGIHFNGRLMTKHEQYLRDLAREEQRYQGTAQAARDLAADKARRDALTLKQGHSLKCGLLRCHPECRKS